MKRIGPFEWLLATLCSKPEEFHCQVAQCSPASLSLLPPTSWHKSIYGEVIYQVQSSISRVHEHWTCRKKRWLNKTNLWYKGDTWIPICELHHFFFCGKVLPCLMNSTLLLYVSFLFVFFCEVCTYVCIKALKNDEVWTKFKFIEDTPGFEPVACCSWVALDTPPSAWAMVLWVWVICVEVCTGSYRGSWCLDRGSHDMHWGLKYNGGRSWCVMLTGVRGTLTDTMWLYDSKLRCAGVHPDSWQKVTDKIEADQS